jgi:hypothetical protein
MNDKELTRLIILGAGASVECGVYPLGSEFINFAKIVRSFCNIGSNNQEFSVQLVEALSNHLDQSYPKIRNKIKSFIPKTIKNLVESSHASIDSHIVYVRNDEERNFLKSLILSIILSCTAYSSLQKSFDNNWYSEIAKLIFPTLASNSDSAKRLKEIEKKIATLQIVTFNYDVSLELYLLDRLQDFFGKESIDLQAKDEPYSKHALRKIMEKIHHVYGQIYNCDEVFLTHQQMNSLGSVKDSPECLWQQDFDRWEGGRRPKLSRASGFDNLTNNRELSNEKHHHRGIFCYLVLKYAILIDSTNLKPKIGNKELSHDRIMVIKEDERSSKIEKDLKDKINNNEKPWDLFYILGYGFDQDNNKLLGLKEINWKRGCFVTNYEKNKKLERVIYNELSREKFYEDFIVAPEEKRTSGDEDYFNPNDKIEYLIPLISNSSVKNALNNEFSLLEESEPLVIKTNLTPYLEMRNK